MYSLPTAPRPIAGVLDDAMRLYRASFGRCWILALMGALLDAIAGVYQTRSLGQLSALSLGDLMSQPLDEVLATLTSRVDLVLHSRGLWFSSLAMLLVWLVICTALIKRQHAVAIAREDSIGAALALSVRRVPSALTAAILSALLIAAGLMLLVVPGLWLGGLFQLWLVPLCIEELGPLKALGRSWQLVVRHWWHASTVVGVAVTIVAIVSMAADVLPGTLLSALVSVFTMPLLTVVMLSLYYDLKLRREGTLSAERLRSLRRA